MITAIIAIISAYLIGSLSTAIIACKLTGLPDPRGEGSGNPGATNVLRFGGKKIAVVVLLGDLIKGLLPVLGVSLLEASPLVIAVTGAAAFLGHLYPIFFGFKGGKGVATAFGVILAISWLAGLTVLGVWLLVALTLRYSSLAALSASVVAPLIVWLYRPDIELLIMMIGMSILLLYRHQSNIQNLLQGKESKIGGKKKTTADATDNAAPK
ncbi:Acyl-phosphate:glycerol-3-phosphate O-acyltransferase PlsY (EC 2.3.1.n3) [hydrothermal vent metagenome]|uniref:Acyl-phosphate:glycerol-3-phosphate O-acyltransferase PlsY n=1 Tax=hydrothermal vent metagenome TaxID=652676 RepID=A0A3B0ZFA9_9ZZZZ